MKKNKYTSPQNRVYKIQTTSMLLEGSGGSYASVPGGGTGKPSVNEDAGRDVWSGAGNSVQW